MVELALALARVAGARICDPTCGDGAFLAGALAAGARAVVGLDVDPVAAAAARARIAGEILDGDLFAPDSAARLGPIDAIVGNPPWVKADRLPLDQRLRIEAAVAATARRHGGDVDAAIEAARYDLAAACVIQALGLVRIGGPVVLVLSSALLDADAAAPVWRAVASLGAVRALIAAPAERWFADAAVNAMVAVIERGAVADQVAVARLTTSTEAGAARLRAGAPLEAIAEVRTTGADPQAWGPALRAPSAWFELAAAAGPALVPLGELAAIRRGVTTGANDVFYLSRARARELDLEAIALSPVVRSPYNGSEAPIAIDPLSTPIVALTLAPDADLAALPRVAAYLATHAAAAERPSLRARQPWWSLPTRPARLFLAKAYGPRFVQRLAPRPVLGDQRVYAIEPRPGVDLDALTGALNGVVTALALEALGRASMGHGALEWTVADAARLPVLDVRRADEAQRMAITAALHAMIARPVEHVLRERALADRAALDAALGAIAPGLAPRLPAIWEALCASVAQRDRWKLPAA